MPRVVPSQIVEFIDAKFPGSDTWERNPGIVVAYAPVLRALISLLDELPSELLTIGTLEYSRFVAARAAIEQQVAVWSTGETTGVVAPVPGDATHPVRTILELLATCRDAAPAPGIARLEFVDDVPLRDQLRIDMTEAYGALHSGEWKAATVLAGSVMEALLLWGLNKTRRPTVEAAYTLAGARMPSPKEFDEWLLWQCIDAARVADLIDENTETQAKLTQDFRNLIHPGRAARLKDKCDRGTSHGAISGMERVATALAARTW